MSLSIRFEPEALADIARAVRFYNRERRGLGDEFRQAVNHRVLALRRFPNSGAVVENVATSLVARQVRARHFPYVIIYVVADEVIRVVAVAHEKRLPAFWAELLESRYTYGGLPARGISLFAASDGLDTRTVLGTKLRTYPKYRQVSGAALGELVVLLPTFQAPHWTALFQPASGVPRPKPSCWLTCWVPWGQCSTTLEDHPFECCGHVALVGPCLAGREPCRHRIEQRCGFEQGRCVGSGRALGHVS